MKSIFALSLFLLLVFVHGMEKGDNVEIPSDIVDLKNEIDKIEEDNRSTDTGLTYTNEINTDAEEEIQALQHEIYSDDIEENEIKSKKKKTIKKEGTIQENAPLQETNPESIEFFGEKDATVVTLTDIAWKKYNLQQSADDFDQPIDINYNWRVLDSTEILKQLDHPSKSFEPINDFEEKINQLYKYSRYEAIPLGDHWCLMLGGKLEDGKLIEPVFIPIANKLIEKVDIPGLQSLRSVLNFGKFANLSPTMGANKWAKLEDKDLFMIKLYLFSQEVLSTPYIDHKKINLLEMLQGNLLGMKTVKDNNQCPYGHSTSICKRIHDSKEYKCGICDEKQRVNVRKCSLCNDGNEYLSMCGNCFNKNKFGKNTKEAMKEHLKSKAAKITGSVSDTKYILKDFLIYISQLNWQIRIQKKIPEEQKSGVKSVFPALGENQSKKSDKEPLPYSTLQWEQFKNAQLLYSTLSVNYHEFYMDTEFNPENFEKWTFQLDIEELEKTIIDLIRIEWTLDARIPALQKVTHTIARGYKNEDHSTVDTTTTKTLKWSTAMKLTEIKVPLKLLKSSFENSKERTSQELERHIQAKTSSTSEDRKKEVIFESSPVDRDVYVLTYKGEYRSTKEEVTWKDTNFIETIPVKREEPEKRMALANNPQPNIHRNYQPKCPRGSTPYVARGYYNSRPGRLLHFSSNPQLCQKEDDSNLLKKIE